MKRRVSPQAIGEALADILGSLPPRAQLSAVRVGARFLQRQRRLHDAAAILRALDTSLLARAGMLRASLTSAESLKSPEVRAIEKRLEIFFGQPVRARVKVRSNLLAGFRADVGGRTVDASLRGLLSRLREKLRRAASAEA